MCKIITFLDEPVFGISSVFTLNVHFDKCQGYKSWIIALYASHWLVCGEALLIVSLFPLLMLHLFIVKDYIILQYLIY